MTNIHRHTVSSFYRYPKNFFSNFYGLYLFIYLTSFVKEGFAVRFS